MLRQSDINQAFRESILRNSKGYQYLHTVDFVSSMQQRGIHFSYSEANRWIERYQSCFADKTPEHTGNRLWILRNMGRVM
ncbi:hypothetical protein FOT81_13865 [Raoultella planticola]|uniref:hypothetical protein n=1 Tax=Raoultella planticola TaxID=575 RepID=UPI0019E8C475|nr:hypothetical protein [Raoultella planticola]MBE0092280.1 hypothetical protein [Raoultella planticola]